MLEGDFGVPPREDLAMLVQAGGGKLVASPKVRNYSNRSWGPS